MSTKKQALSVVGFVSVMGVAGSTAWAQLPSCPAGSQQVVLETANFDVFPPPGWALTNSTTGCNAPGVPDWTNTDPGGRTNLTGGSGAFAIADSDACGSGSVMNAAMTSQALDFTGLSNPTIVYWTDYNDISSTSDEAHFDLSLDGGATWTTLINWNEDHRGPLEITQALTGAAGQGNVKVRWDYVNATWDWWWQVDSVTITGCRQIASPIPTLDGFGLTALGLLLAGLSATAIRRRRA